MFPSFIPQTHQCSSRRCRAISAESQRATGCPFHPAAPSCSRSSRSTLPSPRKSLPNSHQVGPLPRSSTGCTGLTGLSWTGFPGPSHPACCSQLHRDLESAQEDFGPHRVALQAHGEFCVPILSPTWKFSDDRWNVPLPCKEHRMAGSKNRERSGHLDEDHPYADPCRDPGVFEAGER